MAFRFTKPPKSLIPRFSAGVKKKSLEMVKKTIGGGLRSGSEMAAFIAAGYIGDMMSSSVGFSTAKSKITNPNRELGENIGSMIGAGVGMAVGGTLGGLIGSIIPGAGTAAGIAIGTFAGRFIGAGIGSALGSWAGGAIGGKNTASVNVNDMELTAGQINDIKQKGMNSTLLKEHKKSGEFQYNQNTINQLNAKLQQLEAQIKDSAQGTESAMLWMLRA